ncbi:hypothetical protein [Streptococcus agalactiae]|uniref:hypothetical protein n=1 Tax=Streptococcus agalactiae TaxID=1311 RepID=UPI0002BABE97|nr:hypothetical protein [Streptococcus agalactiae]OZV80801.1 hypothetical protein CFK60_07175 [Streptococcus agalactiae]WGT57701.1 hypothetical protein QGO80_07420 [Streptococcus agalactiae]
MTTRQTGGLNKGCNMIDKFYWEPEDMQSVMLAIAEGQSPSPATKDWIELNPDKVEEWLD